MTVGLEVLQIIWINILLSGDNAVVIALACRELHGRARKAGIVLGAGAAVALRIVFTTIITQVLSVPYVKLVGGLVLFWIAAKLLTDEEDKAATVKGHSSLWGAVFTVVVADIVMSLDNVLAIAAAAHGSMVLIVLGLALSVPVVIGGSSLISGLMAKLPVLVWVGAALLGWIAAEMIVSDPLLEPVASTELVRQLSAAIGAALILAIGGYVAMRRAAARARQGGQGSGRQPMVNNATNQPKT
jgi:YjbE family integral membrane protein